MKNVRYAQTATFFFVERFKDIFCGLPGNGSTLADPLTFLKRRTVTQIEIKSKKVFSKNGQKGASQLGEGKNWRGCVMIIIMTTS